MGKYIYGVIPRHCLGQVNSDGEEYFGQCGITACGEVYPVRNITKAGQRSEISNGVYTIPYQNISAVVSDSEIVNYSHLPKDVVARHLIRHQQAIEKVMENFPIIPMRLGTFACDEDEVRFILSKAYPLVKGIFNEIFDKIEIDLVATWNDFTSVLKEVGEEKDVKEYKERLLANSQTITIDDQVKIGVMVKKELDRKREKYTEEIQKALRTVSQDFKVHELMDDKMVINTAFLINKNKQRDFDKKVEELNAKFAEELNFRCVGPLPPYSFYTLEVKKLQFKEIQRAREKLGLNNVATKNEIKKAYQTSAFSSHPDRNPNIPGIEREFDEITKAYKILLDYCKDETCSFNENEFKKNAMLVKIHR